MSAPAPRFLLLFEGLRSVHLHKDVGQVPYQLYRNFGFDAAIATFRNESCYAYIDDDLSGLKLIFIRFSLYWFLLRNARGIDALMLFHISSRTIYRAVLYKMLNPNGCLYVKADLASDRIVYPTWGSKNPLTVLKRKLLYGWFLEKADIVSFETLRSYEGAGEIPDDKKMLVPNGFDPDFPTDLGIRNKDFSEKENLILLVGRHGDPAKNSEFMLEVLSRLGDPRGWRICFIGSLTEDFQRKKEQFLRNNPQFSGYVTFTGNIEDKRELFEYYNRSKILCLTSRSESWGMVCVEALCFGNTLVMTRVNSSDDLTGNGMAGMVIEQGNHAAFAEALRTLMNDDQILAQYHRNACRHFNERFIWKNILQPLAAQITRRTSDETIGPRIC